MFQLNNATVYILTTRITSRFLWRFNVSLTTNTATEVDNSNVKLNQLKRTISDPLKNKHSRSLSDLKASLCHNINANDMMITKIQSATNVHDLLNLFKGPLLSQNDVMKALETISLWVNENNKSEWINVANLKPAPASSPPKKLIEKPTVNIKNDVISKYHDLSTSAMIIELNKLAMAKQRNVQLLNYLFQNIIEYNETLSAGECSSLIHSMRMLTYSDERLLNKISSDLVNILQHSNQITKITLKSIIKSMACVRYKNDTFLKYACLNILGTKNYYESKDIASILLSFAKLGYCSQYTSKIIEQYKETLTKNMLSPRKWFNLVWSYAVFQELTPSHIVSVFDEQFIKNIMLNDVAHELSIQLKLLNINGYAQYAIKNYTGPFLNENIVPPIVAKRSKQKESYVTMLGDTLKNMLPSSSYFKLNVNTGMGFLLDAELHMNSDYKPIAVTDNSVQNGKIFKMGIMIVDYYDTCLGSAEYQGLIKLHNYLLMCKKYDVLCLSYQNFGLEDKMDRRVAYLKRQLWNKCKNSFH